MIHSSVCPLNRPLSHGGHFESQENKKLCFCTSSLALDERLDVQNLLLQHCVIKVYYMKISEQAPGNFSVIVTTKVMTILLGT